MRKILIVAALAALAASVAMAQQQGSAPDKRARVGVVDLDRVEGESLMGKGYLEQVRKLQDNIQAERTKKENELEKMRTEIAALKADLEKQAELLSEDVVWKKRQDIGRKERDAEGFVQENQAELAHMRESAQEQAQGMTAEFQQKIRPHIEAVAKAQGLDILLDVRQAMLIDKSFDISNEVIVKLDDVERASNAAGKPAAPAAAKPAASGAAKPAAPPAGKAPTAKP